MASLGVRDSRQCVRTPALRVSTACRGLAAESASRLSGVPLPAPLAQASMSAAIPLPSMPSFEAGSPTCVCMRPDKVPRGQAAAPSDVPDAAQI